MVPATITGVSALPVRKHIAGSVRDAATAVALAESVVLTLLASLWFDSLGHGGWWLIFLLLGLLQALPGLVLRRHGVRRLVAAVARYVLAGAILAWRLG